MTHTPLIGLIVACTAGTILNLSGCAHLNTGNGNYTDKDFVIITASDLRYVDRGSQVIVILDDGSKVHGKYEGLKYFPSSEYEERYYNYRKSIPDTVMLPAIGDYIEVVIYPDKRYNGEFIGFNYGYPGLICLRMTSSGDSIRIDLERVRYVDIGNGSIIKGTALRSLIATESIPCLTAITIQTDSLEVMVGMNEVRWIKLSVAEKKKLELLFSLLYFAGFVLVSWVISKIIGGSL